MTVLGLVLGGCLVVFLAALLSYRHLRPDARTSTPRMPDLPEVSLPDVSLPDVPLPDWLRDADAPMTVYKWRDDAGAWHFSDHPPKGRESEAIEVAPQNVAPERPAAAPEEAPDRSLSDMIRTPLDRARGAGKTLEAEGDATRERLDAVEGP
jgi:hypothetical protein